MHRQAGWPAHVERSRARALLARHRPHSCQVSAASPTTLLVYNQRATRFGHRRHARFGHGQAVVQRRKGPRYTAVVDFDAIKRVLTAFEREDVRYAIFGAAALNLHGLARFTEDLDVFLEPTADNIARLRTALASVFDDPCIAEITAGDLLGDYPAVQYVPPSGTFHLDLLTRLGQAFAYEDLEVLRVPFEDLSVSVVSPRTLYLMKRDTVRLKDKADAALLKERFQLEDP